MTLLSIERLSVAYGAIRAVHEIDLTVAEGEIVAILGANGAGKSSTLNAIVGLVPHVVGSVRFDGQELVGMQTQKIVQHGITLTPEGRRVFPLLTVEENLRLGGMANRDRRSVNEVRAKLLERFPVLAQRRGQQAGTLSGGEQQMLAIARSLMASPRVLLLDEPSLGLAPIYVDRIFELITELRTEGVTILLVEQNVDRALGIADRGYVLANGQVQFSGRASEMRTSSGIERAYLGIGAA